MTEKLSSLEKQATATIATMDEDGPITVSAARLVTHENKRQVQRRCLGCRELFLHDADDLNPIHRDLIHLTNGRSFPCNTLHQLPSSLAKVSSTYNDIQSWEGRKVSWKGNEFTLAKCSNQTCQYFWMTSSATEMDCLVCGTPVLPETQK